MMKKIFLTFSTAMLAIVLVSCGSSKGLVALSDLEGEWYIIEVKGSVVVPADNAPFPFIGFDTQSGRIQGNSGCNRMTGSFDNRAAAGYITLGQMISTRMACPDMTNEQNILHALAEVKRYKKMGRQIALCNERNSPVLILTRKTDDVSPLSL
jgi:heat shock protein HslJ